MLRRRARNRLVVGALAALACAAAPGAASASTLLRLDGIGPLKLGMTRVAAARTGWLAHRGTGCPLGGPPLPVTYRLSGAAAPRGLAGSVQFEGGRLTNVTVTRGARTALGVRVRRTTPGGMARRYRRAGFAASVRYDGAFQATFVEVRRKRNVVLGAFATGPVITALAIPQVLVCD